MVAIIWTYGIDRSAQKYLCICNEESLEKIVSFLKMADNPKPDIDLSI